MYTIYTDWTETKKSENLKKRNGISTYIVPVIAATIETRKKIKSHVVVFNTALKKCTVPFKSLAHVPYIILMQCVAICRIRHMYLYFIDLVFFHVFSCFVYYYNVYVQFALHIIYLCVQRSGTQFSLDK